ncbi:MAG: bifunctional 3,4-dihydroxy-2-butanone-4-phosphate synthase/GTP cyclohydrolase II [Vicinamibacterales bacterium]
MRKIEIAKGARKPPSPFARIEEAVEAIRAGQMIIVVDDADRENEGDLTIAAEKATPEAINFMARFGRGLICLPMTHERLDELEIPLVVHDNTSRFETAFCTPIDVVSTTTGISAQDRAATVRAAIDPATRPADLARPGHVHPLRARPGGVLVRAGQTEAAVDLARIAGLYPAGVICEIMNEDGTMARVPDLTKFAKRHNLPLVTIADLIKYRIRTESLVKRMATAKLPTDDHGPFLIHTFESQIDSQTHVALVCGEIGDGKNVLVRVHSCCLTGDVFHSARCDCGAQLHAAIARISAEGRGVLLYLDQEGRGIGLTNKIRAYALQDEGCDTVEANERLGFKADQRDYGVGVQILREIGIRSMRLLSNNPRKLVGIEGYGLSVTEWLPLEIPASDSTRRYLKTKKDKLGHKLSSV